MKTIKLLCLMAFMLSMQGCFENPPVTKSDNADFMDIDFRKLVSRADLNYNKPVTLSQAGMPVGTGRMGSLVWTSPSALKFQINRVDVYAVNNSTNSFPMRNTDFANGCGYVDINLTGYGEDVFTS